ncbi:MAG: squalene/phytoene synthase family protein [Planctomycetes bacterium]|nr:squalene/phytoene synthase family protein [Planctomycetota bacterium]
MLDIATRDYCRGVLPAVSRTFALGIELLKEPLRDEIGVAYLICRILDTIEDTTSLPAEARASLLRAVPGSILDPHNWPMLAAEIEKMFADKALAGQDHDLCRHATTVFKALHAFRPGARDAMKRSFVEMAEGMAATVDRELRGEGLKLENMEDLHRYCYYVAGTVGMLLTNEFALDRASVTPAVRKQLDRYAVSFGLGLQVTNIIKGVTDDIERGVTYVPRSLFKRSGIELQTLIDNPNDPRGREVVAGLCEQTLLWLDEALEYTLSVPPLERDIRLFCALPLTFAVRTLARALMTSDVFSESVLKITRDEVKAIHAEVERNIASDRGLREIYAREKADAVAEIERAKAPK